VKYPSGGFGSTNVCRFERHQAPFATSKHQSLVDLLVVRCSGDLGCGEQGFHESQFVESDRQSRSLSSHELSQGSLAFRVPTSAQFSLLTWKVSRFPGEQNRRGQIRDRTHLKGTPVDVSLAVVHAFGLVWLDRFVDYCGVQHPYQE
jgi:hypothetical protein